MARFILDVASKDNKISLEELKKVIDIHKDYFGEFVSTITLVDDTNNQQDELTIDINQYIQEDDEYGDVRIWFNSTKFVDDAVEYLENDNVGSEIIRE